MQQRQRTPVNPGTVEWSGDNPGIYLKDGNREGTNNSDWRRLALYFNIVLSPHGRGKAMLVLGEPDQAAGQQAGNLCISDNPAMVHYLVETFLCKFPTFRGRVGLQHMTQLPMDQHHSTGNPIPGGEYSETLISNQNNKTTSLTMHWKQIGEPFAVEASPEQSATGEHDMYSFFMQAEDASIAINGQPLTGQVVDRPFFGISMRSAFLAMSETWVKPIRPGD